MTVKHDPRLSDNRITTLWSDGDCVTFWVTVNIAWKRYGGL